MLGKFGFWLDNKGLSPLVSHRLNQWKKTRLSSTVLLCSIDLLRRAGLRKGNSNVWELCLGYLFFHNLKLWDICQGLQHILDDRQHNRMDLCVAFLIILPKWGNMWFMKMNGSIDEQGGIYLYLTSLLPLLAVNYQYTRQAPVGPEGPLSVFWLTLNRNRTFRTTCGVDCALRKFSI